MLRVGDQVEIGLLRDGKPLKVTALVAERRRPTPPTPSTSIADSRARISRMRRTAPGCWCAPCRTAAPRRRRDCARTTSIVAVGRTPISSIKAFREAAKGANLLLLNVKRGSAVVLIPIR